ncbi:MAG: septum site-determining protein MinD, partial [Paraclostridium sp.]
STEQMTDLCEKLRESFDYILIDCPAGIEQGFKNAVAGADRAIVVTNPEISAVRDADRIIGLLEANEVKDIRLIINRIRNEMVKRGDMMDKQDIIEILAIDLIGLVPDDESIIVSTNKGEPAILDGKSSAGQAYKNVAKRILGEDIPLMQMENDTNIFSKIKKMFGMAK